MLNGLVTAIRTLTILPCPGRDADKLSKSLYWFPIVGLLLGVILYSIARLPDLYSFPYWPEGTAIILLLFSVLLTRGIHLDGLADLADAFWGARDPKRIMEIMKDSNIGTFGGIALILILLSKWACFVRLINTDSQIWIIPAFVISRTMQVSLASAYPYARSEGGTGASFITEATAKHLITALILSLGLLMAISPLNLLWLTALALSWFITRLFGLRFCKKIGGATGDLLGACSEIVEVSILAMGAIL